MMANADWKKELMNRPAVMPSQGKDPIHEECPACGLATHPDYITCWRCGADVRTNTPLNPLSRGDF